MPVITTPEGVNLHYTDTGGDGRPLVLIHGWPLSGESFEPNIPAFAEAGLRVITYDRRGFGQSDKPSEGYDYDILADDLSAVLDALDLFKVVLLGFSMGGGEVAHFFGTQSPERVEAAVFSGSIAPALCITEDNPDGAMPTEAFEEMAQQCASDREAFLDGFITSFFSTAAGLLVDEPTRRDALRIAQESDPAAAVECIRIWATDLRLDCRTIGVPTLVIHGDGDLNVPLAASSARMPEFVDDAELVVISGGPHGINVTHQQVWEEAILSFIEDLD